MKFTIIISQTAKNHVEKAYNYYESVQEAIGERLLETLELQYDKLKNTPQHYSFLSGKKDLRFLVVPQFPFIIIYQIKGDHVFIIDVHNTHQNS